MNGINKVTLMGRVGIITVHFHFDETGCSVDEATFLMVIPRRVLDKTGESHEELEHIPCVVRGRLAQVMADYVKTGRVVYCEGSLRGSQVTEPDGTQSTRFMVVVDTLQLLSRDGGLHWERSF